MKIFSVYNKETKSHIALYKNREQLGDWAEGGNLKHMSLFACKEWQAMWFVRYSALITAILAWLLIKNVL